MSSLIKKNIPFDKFFKNISSKPYQISKKDYLEEGEFPVVDQGQKFIVAYSNSQEKLFINSPIIIFGDHTRILKYIDFHFVIGADGTKVLTSYDDTIDIKYAYYQLLFTKVESLGYSRHYKLLKEKTFIKHSLKEQKSIAKKLDTAQELIRLRKNSIKKLDELSKALFVDMFGDPVENEMGWEVVKLENLTSKITDGTHKTPKYQTNGITFISAKNVKNDTLNFLNCKYISEEEHTQLIKRCNPEYQDILLTKSGSTGMSTLIPKVDFEFSLFESLCLIKFDKNILNPYFLKLFLNSEATKHQYSTFIKGVAIKHLHLKDIRMLKIINPPLLLQQKFAKTIEKIEAQKALYEEELKEFEDLFESLLGRVFSHENTDKTTLA